MRGGWGMPGQTREQVPSPSPHAWVLPAGDDLITNPAVLSSRGSWTGIHKEISEGLTRGSEAAIELGSDCGGTHNLFEVQSRLVDDISTPPEGSNHALPGTPDPNVG